MKNDAIRWFIFIALVGTFAGASRVQWVLLSPMRRRWRGDYRRRGRIWRCRLWRRHRGGHRRPARWPRPPGRPSCRWGLRSRLICLRRPRPPWRRAKPREAKASTASAGLQKDEAQRGRTWPCRDEYI